MNKRVVLLSVFIGVALFSFFIGRSYFPQLDFLQEFFFKIPFFVSAIIFIVAYVLSAFVVIDLKDVLKVVSALVFGVWGSSLLIWISELFSCLMLFYLARYLGQDWVEKKLYISEKKIHWIQSLTQAGSVFFLRVLPIVPYRMLDIAYGLTNISFRQYFFLSASASPLRIIWLQWMLAGLGGMVFYPEKMSAYLQANPILLWVNIAYVILIVLGIVVLAKAILKKK